MAIIEREAGCKVAWYVFDDRAEAEAAAEEARNRAYRKGNLGYTFGSVSPGNIREFERNGQTVWEVTVV